MNLRTLPQSQRVLLGIGTIALGTVGLLSALAILGQYVQTRLITSAGPRLRVKTGEIQTVTYKTSSRVPAVKIDLCAEKLPLTNCVTLAQTAAGEERNVRIPSDYPLGKALLVVRERQANGRLSGRIQFRRPLLVVQGVSPTEARATTPMPAPSPLSVTISDVRFLLERQSDWVFICSWNDPSMSAEAFRAQVRRNGGEWVTLRSTAEPVYQDGYLYSVHRCSPDQQGRDRFSVGDVVEARITDREGRTLVGPHSVTVRSEFPSPYCAFGPPVMPGLGFPLCAP